MALTSGTELGPYEIVVPLGAGGMGEVYRARDRRLGRDVALKILPAEVANDPVRRQRFEREARAVAALNHPNIVAVYDVGEGYIVGELVDGQPLRGAKLGLRKTIEVAIQIASGLVAAHDVGIVHRDLKPDNIVLTRDGRPKILDFGLAKMQTRLAATDDATVTTQTEAGVVLGTPGYMSPEQARGLATDHRSDIFSFGVILYELLAGTRPFSGETSAEAITAILKQEPPELPETVPVALRHVVAHCLEKDAEERFQSARDLRFSLSQVTESGSNGTVAASPLPVHAWVWRALAAVVMIAATVAATRWLWRDSALPQWSGVLLGGPEMGLNPRLSPDGTLLALKAFDNAQTQVAVMKPESGNWSILTHSNRGVVEQVSWSPDGSLIYYDRATDVPLGVYSVPVLGGEEHVVLENALSPEALPDGSLLLSRVNAGRVDQLYRFWPETGRIKEFPLQRRRYFAPACSRMAPGGREVITYASPIEGGGQGPGLYAIDLATNAIRRLALPEQEAAALQAWTVAGDGESVLAALPAGSITRIVTIPTSGQSAARTLFTVTSSVWYLEAARDQGLFVNLVDRPLELVRLSSGGAGPSERIASFPVGGGHDQILLLPDGRTVAPARASGRTRLMAAEKGKDPLPLVNTQEETAAPMTLAGPREIAFVIGPSPHNTIALAETATGRIVRRIAPGKGVINGLTAPADGGTLYFCAGGSVWAIPSSGGEARAVSTGEYAVMDISGRSLIVVRRESSHIRMFHVPLDGAPEREISLDSSIPLYGDHGGYFSSGSIDAKGRLLIGLSPFDSWFNPLGILATDTGRVTRVAGETLSDHHSGVWTPDGRILSAQVSMRATIWKFRPIGK